MQSDLRKPMLAGGYPLTGLPARHPPHES